MKNNTVTVMKKEFARFFKDKRMLITTLILPGLLIFLLYTFMGDAMTKSFTPDEGYRYKVYAVNCPDELRTSFDSAYIDITDITDEGIEAAELEVSERGADLIAVFPKDFIMLSATYDASSGLPAPEVILKYNSARTESSVAYSTVEAVLNAYETAISNKFDINRDVEDADLASEKDTAGMVFSMMMPMLMMSFLFSGCMAVAPESIAGEKERGTVATLLVTPIKRGEIAVGKIAALSVIALLSGLSSFIGTVFSLPKLMGDAVSVNVYGLREYAMLLAVIISTVLVIVSAISVISAFSKTVKEATSAVMPLMILSMLLGVTSMLGEGAPQNAALYLIPLYNSVQCMNGVLSFTVQPLHIIITFAVNVVFSLLLALLLTKMFSDEKIMFSK